MRGSFRIFVTAISLVAFDSCSITAADPTPQTLSGSRALVIGHRGASGYRPEHTLEAYDLAITLGADYIEPDLVPTKDGFLVARHENALAIQNPDGTVREATTNVHEIAEFAPRRQTKTIDGAAITGWFTEDFTLAELKTLRARERIPTTRPRNATYNDKFLIPTLEEVIALAKSRSVQLGRIIGVYPETKHPSYFRSIGRPIEEALVRCLHVAYGDTRTAPVFIQSFEVRNLQELRAKTSLKLVQLLDDRGRPWDFELSQDPRTYVDLAKPEGLKFIRTYAAGIGPAKNLVIPRRLDGGFAAPTSLLSDAHALGLVVHPFTFRAENRFLPAQFRRGSGEHESGDLVAELRAFLATGIDGFFTDHPDLGHKAVTALP